MMGFMMHLGHLGNFIGRTFWYTDQKPAVDGGLQFHSYENRITTWPRFPRPSRTSHFCTFNSNKMFGNVARTLQPPKEHIKTWSCFISNLLEKSINTSMFGPVAVQIVSHCFLLVKTVKKKRLRSKVWCCGCCTPCFWGLRTGPWCFRPRWSFKKTRLLMLVMQVEKTNNFGSSFLFLGVEHRCYSNGSLRCFWGALIMLRRKLKHLKA